MTGTVGHVLAAALCFVGLHFALSMRPARPWLVEALGENGFLGLYSAQSIFGLIWLSLAYRHAPYVELWGASAAIHPLVLAVMPVAVFLLVASLTTPNPTMVGGERTFDQTNPARGIFTITRHPMLWGVALWAGAHALANGDAASLILFGAMLVLAVGGMVHIDIKRRARMGAAWGPFAMATSLMPFQAIAEGRTQLDLAGIGWRRVGLALLVFAGLLLAHPWLSGVVLVVW
ncbi:MAG: hypothetical protein EXQ92_09605 [Alphaproteobacteria bacterium]|nr:hypothetical protein [Alphaproteobacteria bacterium]